MINILFSRVCILTCGTLYPGYMSFKTVRAKIVEDYVKWMMYWIVFSIFTATETFTDIFLSWFPFYYESKVVLILWLLPTMGNGSTFIYKNFIHPLLKRHETRVDQHLVKVREKALDLIFHYMKEAVLYSGRSIMNFFNKNFPNGVLGVLANDPYSNSRPLQVSSNMVIEEIQEEDVAQVPLKTKNRKYSTRASSKADEAPHSSRGRGRKVRHTKAKVDFSLNED